MRFVQLVQLVQLFWPLQLVQLFWPLQLIQNVQHIQLNAGEHIATPLLSLSTGVNIVGRVDSGLYLAVYAKAADRMNL